MSDVIYHIEETVVVVQLFVRWNLNTNRDISEYFRGRRLPLRKKNKYNVIKPDLYSLNIYFGFKC